MRLCLDTKGTVAGPFVTANITDLLGYSFFDEPSTFPVEGEAVGAINCIRFDSDEITVNLGFKQKLKNHML